MLHNIVKERSKLRWWKYGKKLDAGKSKSYIYYDLEFSGRYVRNAGMRYYIKEVLGDKVNIAVAGNGLEALQWLESNIPDLIISDVMMPGMDGRELVNKLKNHDHYKKIRLLRSLHLLI